MLAGACDEALVLGPARAVVCHMMVGLRSGFSWFAAIARAMI